MAKRSKGTEDTQPGDVVYGHDDKVKFKVKYDKTKWPEKNADGTPGPPRHMPEGEVYILHQKHAETLAANGQGEIIEFLNDKRDKGLDAAAKEGKLKAKASS